MGAHAAAPLPAGAAAAEEALAPVPPVGTRAIRADAAAVLPETSAEKPALNHAWTAAGGAAWIAAEGPPARATGTSCAPAEESLVGESRRREPGVCASARVSARGCKASSANAGAASSDWETAAGARTGERRELERSERSDLLDSIAKPLAVEGAEECAGCADVAAGAGAGSASSCGGRAGWLHRCTSTASTCRRTDRKAARDRAARTSSASAESRVTDAPAAAPVAPSPAAGAACLDPE